mmetsp:Transcript_42422/g.139415  ORF Transcript_42422/g.139415 Transcript_42422/m.139415 type:complete len:269 (+) Transcript_42422:85-891(+)
MRKPRVLVLGGWSGGPLDYLRRRWSGECTFVEPPLHMPPQGARWCFTWEAALLAGAACLPWAVSAAGCGAAAALVTGAAVLCLAPRLVALLVRGAIRRSVAAAELCLKGGTVDLVVGFSWGGGVACWLLSERRWRGPTLLLAPTLEAMASAARLALPAPFFSARGGGGGARCCHDEADEADEAAGAEAACIKLAAGFASQGAAAAAAAPPLVHIFHASDDGFCPPSQHEALQRTGAAMHRLSDSHVFMTRQSEEEIGRVFGALLGSGW